MSKQEFKLFASFFVEISNKNLKQKFHNRCDALRFILNLR